MCQRFYANPRTKQVETNGAISYGPGGPFDCLGNYSKVENCPIRYLHVEGYDHHWYELEQRYTVYATGYADTYFTVPAATRVKCTYISGSFTSDERGLVFNARGGRIKVENGELLLLRSETKANPEHWVKLAAKRVEA